MPINYQQVYSKIRAIGAEAQTHEQALKAQRERARQLLESFAEKTAWLRERLEEARRVYPDLRCAIPLEEPLNARHPLPDLEANYTLLAADGSQIAPDRHATVLFGLVNIGIICMRRGSGKTPETFTESHLLFDEELYTEEGHLLNESLLAMQRDLRERALLAEMARQAEKPAIALTDGPLELWGLKEAESTDSYRRALEQYLRILKELRGQNVIPAGYVDKPMANLVVRLLEIASLPQDALKDLKEHYPLRGVSDRWLFGERGRPLLRAGERSAVFGLQSRSRQFYREEIALHFFYLNVGDDQHPWPVRVEVPAWVARDRAMLDRLHVALVEQCRMMGARPFPYLLHRAHEIALVSRDEKSQIETMLVIELRGQGQEIDETSAKQTAKEGPRREW